LSIRRLRVGAETTGGVDAGVQLDLSDDIFTVMGYFSAIECDGYIRLSESLGFGDAPTSTFGGPVMAKELRDNARIMLDDPALAQPVRERARPYISAELGDHRACGMNERFRFDRYDPGQTFRWHRDGSFERPGGQRIRLTLMVYLNDEFEGDETRFEQATIRPMAGMALFFVHHLLHEGAGVIRGRKHVMRTDAMYSG
jgi:hypothetical protein